MVAAGTRLAPMRGFVQERGAIVEAQKDVSFGKVLLYFGCRDPGKDYICQRELEQWEKQGVVELRPAFSQVAGACSGYKYVPGRLWAERGEIVELFQAGAKVFLCRSAAKLAKSTNVVFEKIVMEAKSCSVDEA